MGLPENKKHGWTGGKEKRTLRWKKNVAGFWVAVFSWTAKRISSRGLGGFSEERVCTGLSTKEEGLHTRWASTVHAL